MSEAKSECHRWISVTAVPNFCGEVGVEPEGEAMSVDQNNMVDRLLTAEISFPLQSVWTQPQGQHEELRYLGNYCYFKLKLSHFVCAILKDSYKKKKKKRWPIFNGKGKSCFNLILLAFSSLIMQTVASYLLPSKLITISSQLLSLANRLNKLIFSPLTLTVSVVDIVI